MMSQKTICNLSKTDLHSVVSVAANLAPKTGAGLDAAAEEDKFSPDTLPFKTLRSAFLEAEIVPLDREELYEASIHELSDAGLDDEQITETTETLAAVAALADTVRPHLVFTHGRYACIEAGLADEIGLSASELMSANAGIALVNAELDYAAPLMYSVSIVPDTVETASLLAVVIHQKFPPVPITPVLVAWIGWLWKLLKLLWKLYKWLTRIKKRIKAARRLQKGWKVAVKAGKMTKAAYRKKLLGLIWKLKTELAAVTAAMVDAADELKEIYEKALKEEDPERKKELLEEADKIKEKLEELKKFKEELEAEKQKAEDALKEK